MSQAGPLSRTSSRSGAVPDQRGATAIPARGRRRLSGLATVAAESGPSGWTGAAGEVFPKAKYFHKSGLISDHALELGYVDDSANGGPRYFFVPVIGAGHATKPVDGETLVGRMSLEIAKWVKASSK